MDAHLQRVADKRLHSLLRAFLPAELTDQGLLSRTERRSLACPSSAIPGQRSLNRHEFYRLGIDGDYGLAPCHEGTCRLVDVLDQRIPV